MGELPTKSGERAKNPSPSASPPPLPPRESSFPQIFIKTLAKIDFFIDKYKEIRRYAQKMRHQAKQNREN